MRTYLVSFGFVKFSFVNIYRCTYSYGHQFKYSEIIPNISSTSFFLYYVYSPRSCKVISFQQNLSKISFYVGGDNRGNMYISNYKINCHRCIKLIFNKNIKSLNDLTKITTDDFSVITSKTRGAV